MKSPSPPAYRTHVAVLSLVVGPLLMSMGDLMHPEERMEAADQANIIMEHASRWYAAHLLLFVGLLVFVPGILALTSLAAERRPSSAHWVRLLLVAGVGVFSAVFMAEMLMGRYASEGADVAAETRLLETFQSSAVFGVILAGAVAFFGGIGLFTVPLVGDGGALRWPALLLALGSLLILAEIVSAQVVLSQIGNVVVLVAGTAFARHLVRSQRAALSA
jgi:hypothetical protein